MTIDNLKCFILVAENLSFARTAEALYISQPAVTKQINVLEQELGVSLFLRTTRHVELTPAGMSFYKDAKDIVQKAQMAVSRLQSQNFQADSLFIGLGNPIALFFLTPFLQKFHASHPDIRPSIELPGYKMVRTLFLEKKLDILFYYKANLPRQADVSFLELKKDSLRCLMAADHPLAGRESLRIQDLKDVPIIACSVLNAPLATASFQEKILERHAPDKVVYCDTIEAAHCLAAAGMGVSILPELLTLRTPGFSAVPFQDDTQLSFGAFYHKRSKNTALHKFLQHLNV